MTIIELFYICLVIASGFCAGKFLGFHFGIIGWIVGIPLGLIVAILALWFIGVLINPWNKGNPKLPVCTKGKYHSAGDYEIIGVTDAGTVFCCSCGTTYLFTGRRFMVYIDHTPQPYMKRTRFGPWEEDKGERKDSASQLKN